MEYRKWMEYLGTSAGQNLLTQLYGAGQAAGALERYGQLMQQHVQRTGAQEIRLFSASGRTEVSGNHTDHNHGLVLAAGDGGYPGCGFSAYGPHNQCGIRRLSRGV